MKVIKSGECVMGACGDSFDKTDSFGRELFVGDIVQIWKMNNGEFDHGSDDGFTSVVNGQYTSYSNGEHKENDEYDTFVMGIKEGAIIQPEDIAMDDGEGSLSGWFVKKIKCHSEAVIGEKWSSFGLHYADEDL